MAARGPVVHVFSCVSGLSQSLKASLPAINVINVSYKDNDAKLDTEEKNKLGEAEVLVADPALIKKYNLLYELPKLKWLQSTFAGVDAIFHRLDESKDSPGFTLTKVYGIFGPHMAEFTVAHIIARERQFAAMLDDQRSNHWNKSAYMEYRILSDLSLGILGIGDIGREVARAVKAFGMKVWGWGTQEGSPRTPCSHLDEYRGPSGLSEVLKNCDYVCSILPDTPQTTGLLSGDTLSHCKEKKSVLMNLGRGNVINESSIINALGNDWIGGAILDVFQEEPLPKESALWSHPNITIAPHVSAVTRRDEMVKVFLENYQRYTSGEELKGVVGWTNGY